MGIHLPGIAINSGLHPNAKTIPFLVPANAVASIAAAVTLNVITAPNSITIINNGWILGDAVSIAATTGGGVAASATFLIQGLNQWGEAVSEIMTLSAVASGTTVQSQNCYRQISAITCTAIGVSNAATVSFGTQAGVTTDNTTRIKLALHERTQNPAITAGANPQTANAAEWIAVFSNAGVVQNIQNYDGTFQNLSINANVGGSVLYFRYNFRQLGARV